MARLLLFCIVAAHVLAIVVARPLQGEAQTTIKVELSAPHDANPSPPAVVETNGEAGKAAASATEAAGEEASAQAEAPETAPHKNTKHHSVDKSIAGGEIILGGLATAIFAAVFCYIRVTRKRKDEEAVAGAETKA